MPDDAGQRPLIAMAMHTAHGFTSKEPVSPPTFNPATSRVSPAEPTTPAETLPALAGAPWKRLAAAALSIAIVVSLLPLWASIPPLVESDYAYLLTAANRLVDGKGLTTTPPVAPFQPWGWTVDWTFLTQWPAGYPLFLAGLRKALGISAPEASRLVNILACAAALVGWFALTWRALAVASTFRESRSIADSAAKTPAGRPCHMLLSRLTRLLVAAVAAGSAVPVSSLVNPSTDIIVAAALPWIMLWLCATSLQTAAREGARATTGRAAAHALCGGHGPLRLGLAGVACGLMFWFRYAGLFIPLALGAWLVFEWARKRMALGHAAAFIVGSAVPIVLLIGVNHWFGAGAGTQAQLNLGRTVGFDLSWAMVAEAWRQFTSFGFYAHRAFVPWVFSLWPIVLIAAALLVPGVRRAMRNFVATPAISMSIAVVIALLLMLVATTALFSEKYRFVELARYYQPIKPLYFVLFVGPLLLIPRRALRVWLCVGLLAMASWTVRYDWGRSVERWAAADRAVTPSGAWSRASEPNAAGLYEWLSEIASDNLVVVSNFHEYIAFESGIAAVPIPPDRAALDQWLLDIAESRGVANLRVVFVLDRDNRWRGHWIAPPEEVIERFALQTLAADAPVCGAMVWEYGRLHDAVSQIRQPF